jgi:hypothetical protein
MGFRSDQWLAERRFKQLQEQEAGALAYLVRRRVLLNSATVNEDVIGDLRDHCARIVTRTDEWLQSSAGINDQAKRVLNDATFDVAAAWDEVRVAMTALHDACVALGPRGTPAGRDATPSSKTFTLQEVGPVVIALDALIAAHRK